MEQSENFECHEQLEPRILDVDLNFFFRCWIPIEGNKEEKREVGDDVEKAFSFQVFSEDNTDISLKCSML